MNTATAVQELSTAQASEYDHILLIDKSGSMGEPSKRFPGKTRWQEAREYAVGLASFLAPVDEDGITVITFNGSVNVQDNVKGADAVTSIFDTQSPAGSTALDLAIRAAETKRAQSGKKCMFHVFTDGVPNDETGARNAIIASVKTMKDDSDLAISFLQIGDDQAATRYLKGLDDGLAGHDGVKFDAVNVVTAAEAENLNYNQILWLALND